MNEIQLLAKIKNEIKNHFTFNTANKSLIEIIDDTAIISNSVGMQILTSDMLIEDIHFSKQTASFEDIGWKAIARNLSLMSSLEVPILVNIVGEGGSGGALAIAVGDHISMMEFATYSVASPEACASIVWRDSSKAELAAEAMQLNSNNILKLKLIDEVLEEPLGGAHRSPDQAALILKRSILKNLDKLQSYSSDDLLERRYKRLSGFGAI